MHITMCLLVRNEESIIEENITFHSKMGVDRFLVMNHLSTDSTLAIMEALKETDGIDIQVYEQTEPTYMQANWMTFLAQEAHRLGTEWIVMCDADEFWLPDERNMKVHLASIPEDQDAVHCQWNNSVPMKGVSPFYMNTYFVKKPHDPGLLKIAMRSVTNCGVTMGNHNITHSNRIFLDHKMRVMHYQNRDKNSAYTKYVLGGTALVNSGFDSVTGWHWRDGLEAFNKGTFDAFLDKHFIEESEILKMPGIYKDESIKREFN